MQTNLRWRLMYRQRRWRPLCAFWASQLRGADSFWRQLARHQGQTVGTSIGCGTRLSNHEGEPMGGERFLQLAGHRGRPTDCFRWITHTEIFICEEERAAGSLDEQTKRDFNKSSARRIKGRHSEQHNLILKSCCKAAVETFQHCVKWLRQGSLICMWNCMVVVLSVHLCKCLSLLTSDSTG